MLRRRSRPIPTTLNTANLRSTSVNNRITLHSASRLLHYSVYRTLSGNMALAAKPGSQSKCSRSQTNQQLRNADKICFDYLKTRCRSASTCASTAQNPSHVIPCVRALHKPRPYTQRPI